MDFAPPVVLRFTRGKLLDVSTEFQSYYDDKIAKLRADLNPQDLRDFKSSDGRLPAPVPFTVEAQHRRAQLERVKIKILEIVWSYLYSGREEAAWNALAEFGPAEDADRVRAANAPRALDGDTFTGGRGFDGASRQPKESCEHLRRRE